ncbi:MAG: hypothetical protein ACOC82_04775 [Candidatus Bipolaricaulota bacterium]
MSKGKLFLASFYALVLLVGVGLIIGGGSILWAETFMKDSDGFYTTRKVEVRRSSHAITSDSADIDVKHLSGLLNWIESIEVKLTAENERDEGVFIGIAPADDLKEYLNGVHHDRIEEVDLNHPIGDPEISYKNYPGTSSPSAPSSEEFWSASKSGTGEQVLKWGIEEGTYAVALMNQDGSAGLDIKASIGANAPIASGLGLWLTVAGLLLALFSFLFLYFTVTRSKI